MKKSGRDRLKRAICGSTLSTAARSPFPDGEGYDTRAPLSPTHSLPRVGNAIKLSGRTFLAPHRGSSPKGRGGYVAVLHESVGISIASDYST